MNQYERSLQLWPLLIFAARNQKILSYKVIEQLTGIPRQGIGSFLGPIQDYCKRRNLPPLTAVVVNELTGLPGHGFTESRSNVLAEQSRVFVFDWLAQGAPTERDLQETHQKRPAKVAR
jgi:hypothetical protein